jgi:hypothetical protein
VNDIEFFDLHIRSEDGKITHVSLSDGYAYRFEVELSDTVKSKLYRALKVFPRRAIGKEKQRVILNEL